MAKKQQFNFDEFLKVSPSYPTLFAMVLSFFLSGLLLGIIQWAFGWIPFIGGTLVAGFFTTLNLVFILLGMLFIFIVEWLVSRDFAKAMLAFMLFLIFDLLPFNFIYPVILIIVKAVKGR